jgi:hypothetical protein
MTTPAQLIESTNQPIHRWLYYASSQLACDLIE